MGSQRPIKAVGSMSRQPSCSASLVWRLFCYRQQSRSEDIGVRRGPSVIISREMTRQGPASGRSSSIADKINTFDAHLAWLVFCRLPSQSARSSTPFEDQPPVKVRPFPESFRRIDEATALEGVRHCTVSAADADSVEPGRGGGYQLPSSRFLGYRSWMWTVEAAEISRASMVAVAQESERVQWR